MGLRTIATKRSRAGWRYCGYGFALLLPWLGAVAKVHFHVLREVPLALPFLIIALITFFFDFGAIILVVAANIFFNAQVVIAAGGPAPVQHAVIHSIFLIASAVLIFLGSRHHRKTEEELRNALASVEERTAAMAEAQRGSRTAAWIYNSRDRRTYWFEGGAEIFGRSFEEMTGAGAATDVMLEEDRPKIAGAVEHTIRTGEPFVVDARVEWPNGEIHWLAARGTPMESDPTLWRGVTMDVTERKQAELALLRSEKLAAVGRLASSIAHEINNPLESVTNLIYLAKSDAARSGEAVTYLEMAEQELARIAQITSQTLRFHRQQSAAAEVDMVEMVESILLFFDRRIERMGVTVRMESKGAGRLICYAGEMRQVLTNLIGNALDAMPHGGRLRVRVQSAMDWRRHGGSLRITVADTGHGMSAETRKRLFEPFFTTRNDTGTGLGLWVSAGIVEKHHGSLSVRSSTSPGRSGTVFVLSVPYATEPSADSRAAPELGETLAV